MFIYGLLLVCFSDVLVSGCILTYCSNDFVANTLWCFLTNGFADILSKSFVHFVKA